MKAVPGYANARESLMVGNTELRKQEAQSPTSPTRITKRGSMFLNPVE